MSHWQDVDEDTEGTYDELVRFFVRGAPCILTERFDTEAGITKGSVGYFEGAVWKDGTVDIDSLPVGVVSRVPQPDFVLIRFAETDLHGEEIICLKRKSLSK